MKCAALFYLSKGASFRHFGRHRPQQKVHSFPHGHYGQQGPQGKNLMKHFSGRKHFGQHEDHHNSHDENIDHFHDKRLHGHHHKGHQGPHGKHVMKHFRGRKHFGSHSGCRNWSHGRFKNHHAGGYKHSSLEEIQYDHSAKLRQVPHGKHHHGRYGKLLQGSHGGYNYGKSRSDEKKLHGDKFTLSDHHICRKLKRVFHGKPCRGPHGKLMHLHHKNCILSHCHSDDEKGQHEEQQQCDQENQIDDQEQHIEQEQIVEEGPSNPEQAKEHHD